MANKLKRHNIRTSSLDNQIEYLIGNHLLLEEKCSQSAEVYAELKAAMRAAWRAGVRSRAEEIQLLREELESYKQRMINMSTVTETKWGEPGRPYIVPGENPCQLAWLADNYEYAHWHVRCPNCLQVHALEVHRWWDSSEDKTVAETTFLCPKSGMVYTIESAPPYAITHQSVVVKHFHPS